MPSIERCYRDLVREPMCQRMGHPMCDPMCDPTCDPMCDPMCDLRRPQMRQLMHQWIHLRLHPRLHPRMHPRMHRASGGPTALGGLKALAACGALALLAGCSYFSAKPPAPPAIALPVVAAPATVQATISAAGEVNLGALKHASPVVVRVYELKSAAVFESAAFLPLFENERATLGADLVMRDEFIVAPGATVIVPKRPAASGSTVLGIVAAFQSWETAAWRATVEIKPNADNRYLIRLDGAALKAVVLP
jgi:type VI secretion system protein VasD